MKILVPIDGSESANNAVKYALALAKGHSKIEITLITTVNISDFYSDTWDVGTVNESLIAAAKEHYATILEKAEVLFKAEGISLKTVLIDSGNPAKAIIDMVEKQGFEQIIMGTRGLTGLKNLILGSVANKVISHIKVPVTLIH